MAVAGLDHKILWVKWEGQENNALRWTGRAGRPISWRMDIGTKIFTWLHGRVVGTDSAGNRYFTEKRERATGRTRRWVVYAGVADATAVPAEWHCWLHYTTDAPLPDTGRRPWQKPHLANATGTASSYRPKGHDYSGGARVAASVDYEAWTPGS